MVKRRAIYGPNVDHLLNAYIPQSTRSTWPACPNMCKVGHSDIYIAACAQSRTGGCLAVQIGACAGFLLGDPAFQQSLQDIGKVGAVLAFGQQQRGVLALGLLLEEMGVELPLWVA